MSEPIQQPEPGSLRRLKPVDSICPPQPAVAALSSFIGRDIEISNICNELQKPDVRLLTITGPGGVGKTRLALEVAQQLEGTFPDGIRFVLLENTSDPNWILQLLADALGFPDSADIDIGKRLRLWLEPRHMLIVLDNLEQISGAAPPISYLLKECPHLTVLATSRIRLNVYGERVHAVSPLKISTEDEAEVSTKSELPEALRLFQDRALAADASFKLTEENLPLATEICRQLDGLPLAIELATARINVLTLTEIRDRLRHGHTLLASTSHDVPDRQRTIHNAITWSYDLLHDDEKKLFRVLSVFVNGFTRNAVAAMLNESPDDLRVLDLVERLTSSSLLMYENDANGERRFRMLQLIREYGLTQLSTHKELQQAQQRHLDWTVAFVQNSEKAMVGENQRTGLQRIDAERDNIATALSHALSIGDVQPGLLICSGLWLYWNTRGMISEGLGWTNAFLAEYDDMPASVLAAGYFTQGILFSHSGRTTEASEAAEKSLEFARVHGNPLQLGLAHYLKGLIANKTSDFVQAEQALSETLAKFQEAGEHTGQAAIINDLGRTAYLQGNLDLAGERFNEALEVSHRFNMPRSIAMSLHNLGNLAVDQKDYPKAAKLHLECLAINLEHGDDWHIMLPLISLVRVAAESGNTPLAARLTGAAEAMVDQPGVSLWDWTIPEDYAQTLEATHTILADDQLQTEIANGRRLTIHQAVAEASALTDDDAPPALKNVLTPRERDVLRLLLDDLTDREIGEELFISRRTAQTHLSSVYKKLGVHSRPEATEAARRLGFG